MATDSFTCKQAIPAFTPQPQSITALWLVLIYHPTEGKRLSRTQPPTLSWTEMSTGQSGVMLCGWGVKAGWLILYADKRAGGR